MFVPPHWHHKNTKFIDQEIDETISKFKKIIPKVHDNHSSFHESTHPESIWLEHNDKIIKDVLDNMGLFEHCTYNFKYWAQLYLTDCLHNAHHHFHKDVHISFVHFIRVTDKPLFRFTNCKGDYYIPKQNQGDLLLFPSWVWHEVISNKSNLDRFVVAGNIEIEYMQTRPFIPSGTHDD